MFYYIEKKEEISSADSKNIELIKLNEALKVMQLRIVAHKSDKYNFDFSDEKEKLTATKYQIENASVTIGSQNEEEKRIQTCGGTVVNKYKQKLQSMLGKKLPRSFQAQEKKI